MGNLEEAVLSTMLQRGSVCLCHTSMRMCLHVCAACVPHCRSDVRERVLAHVCACVPHCLQSAEIGPSQVYRTPHQCPASTPSFLLSGDRILCRRSCGGRKLGSCKIVLALSCLCCSGQRP